MPDGRFIFFIGCSFYLQSSVKPCLPRVLLPGANKIHIGCHRLCSPAINIAANLRLLAVTTLLTGSLVDNLISICVLTEPEPEFQSKVICTSSFVFL
jgi:hypothetical protein